MSRPSSALSSFAAHLFALRGQVVAGSCLIAALASPARSQANIPAFRGDVGLLAGTQAPPGVYAGLFYNYYHASRVMDRDFVPLPITTTTNAGALLLEYSSNWKILGGRWAALMGIPWTNVALETSFLEVGSNWGFSDLYVLPLQLGWNFKQADVVFGQGFFAPTGRYQAGVSTNTGLGLWSWETSVGATVYKDTTRKLHFSTLASYQVQGEKRDTDRRPGNVLTLEGGVGARFRKINGRAGAVYYAQWKLTDDKNFILPQRFDAHHRYFGIGPEMTFGVLTQPVFLSFTIRYYREMWNRVAPQGGSLFVSGTASLPRIRPKPPTPTTTAVPARK
jgi:hypothetical protein